MNKRRGVTLLELLTVVIIVGILAVVAIPGLLKGAERSRPAQVLEMLGAIRGAEFRFKAAGGTGEYTTNLQDDDIDINLPASPPAGSAWTGNFEVTGTGPGADVTVQRKDGGTGITNALLMMDLDTGNLCASTAEARKAWSVGTPSAGAGGVGENCL